MLSKVNSIDILWLPAVLLCLWPVAATKPLKAQALLYFLFIL
jgi:hypothetical protein